MIAWKIVKIVLLVLAGIAALALAVLLIALLGNIRYRADGAFSTDEEEKKKEFSGWFSYLLPLFRERFALTDGKFTAKDYLFGIPLKKPFAERLTEKKEKAEGRQKKKESVSEEAAAAEETSSGPVGFSGFGPHKKETFWERIGKKAKKIRGRISDIAHKIAAGAETVSDYADALNVLFPYIRRGLRIVLPKRFEVSVAFGFEDPSVTGQVLGLICVLTEGLTDGKKRVLNLDADFDKQTFSASGSLIGRFNLFRILIVVIAAALDKDVRAVLKRI